MRLPKSFTSLAVAFAAASVPRFTSIIPPSAALVMNVLSASLSEVAVPVVVVLLVMLDVSVALVAVSVALSFFLQANMSSATSASRKINFCFINSILLSRASLRCTKSSSTPDLQELPERVGEPLVFLRRVVELGGYAEDPLGRLWPRDHRHLDGEAFEESILELIAERGGRGGRASVGDRNRRHRAQHVVRRRFVDRQCLAEDVTGLQRQRVIPAHDLLPPAGDERRKEAQRLADRKPRRGIEGSGPIEFQLESRSIGAF